MSKILKVVGASWLQTKISSYVLGFLGVLAILALFVGQIERIQEDGTYAATVFYSEKTGYRIEYWGQSNELAEIPKGVARAYFRMDIETTGWSLLEVETDESYPDEVQAYAAGIVEGALTWYLIHTHLENTIRAKCEDRPIEKQCEKLRGAFDKSVNTMKAKAAERGNAEPFWHHVSLYYTQIEGIYTGWKHGVERSEKEYETDISDLFWLNSIAEAIEIQRKLNISLDDSMFDKLPSLSTAFLRILNETSEEGKDIKKLYVAHNAAGNYSAMTRILKRYKFNYHMTSKDQSLAPGSVIDFSSYPGAISSQDEFYLISGTNNNMAITGTPLRNYNNKLWKDVNITEEVPLGPRLMVANRIATNASSWGHILAGHNSGTGSKQWLVVDFKRLKQLHETPLNEAAKSNKVIIESTVSEGVKHTIVHRSSSSHFKGLVWLIEQIPGHTHSADISDVLLEQGYWATYGLPFFQNISEITHTDIMKELYGNIFSESECSRAVMFKLNHKHVKSTDDVIRLMRHNNATAINRVNNETNDCADIMNCLIDEDGYWSVMGARGDVVNKFKEAYGVIDTKLISGTFAVGKKSSVEFIAISGPPYTRQNSTKLLYNKGNIASIYTDQFDNEPFINGVEIRDLVKQKQDEAEKEALEVLNRDVITPFQWSKSDYESDPHILLPDKWAFGPFKPKWSW